MAKQEQLTPYQQHIRDVLATNLTHFRKAQGWTIARLAQETGYSIAWISGIECSRMNSSTDRLAHIADTLGIQVYLLFVDRR
jgi:transcriptional regulator with XRE-family HTH domain